MRQAPRTRSRQGKTTHYLAVAVLGFALLAGLAPSARAGQYDPRQAGHPLRVAAYILHPAGVILDTFIFHPAWWLAGFEPIRTLVGRERPRQEQPLPQPQLESDED